MPSLPFPNRRRAFARYAAPTSTAVGAMLLLAAFLAGPASAAPSCEEGPQQIGEVIYGTPCADMIHTPRGVTTVYGEGGDDTIYGGRGNQSLYGGPGNDRLYGGIGDDHLRGGPGDDLLSGGFGADSLDGEEGSDYVRGDATIDYLGDSGAATDVDTLSFVTGATPGFPNAGNFGFENFPAGADGRGVFIELGQDFANDGVAPAGGGVDNPLPEATNFEDFEIVVGTPFSDFIVGGPNTEAIYGGGGSDVILDEGFARVDGGAGGDYCESGGFTSSCKFEGDEEEVEPRDPSKIAVGLMGGSGEWPVGVYLDGSEAADDVSATYTSEPPSVVFEVQSGSSVFDAGEAEAGECDAVSSTKAVCPLTGAPDAIDLAGLGGDDSFSAHGFPATTSIVELGGDDADRLTGTEAEDVLVDGTGNDVVDAAGGDDALPNNQGSDELLAGPGNDLFISDAVCEGDFLSGGGGVDNANWANFKESPVSIDLAASSAGLLGAGGLPDCGEAPKTALHEIEDIEGTDAGDTLIGDAGENQLLGRRGEDSYHAGAGNDTILANSGTPTPDPDPVIDCGEGYDTAEIDYPQNGPDATPVECESVYERAPNSFRPPDTPPNPNPPPEAPTAEPSSVQPPHDRTPPQTRLLHRPAKRVFTRRKWRRVAFVLGSSESGSGFRCRVDRRPFRPCRSPRAYRVRLGRHAFRAYAIDAAGNRDRTPVVYRFAVRRLIVRSSRSHRRRGSSR